MPPLTATLPFPPSTNRYWRQYRGHTVLSAAGRAYRDAVLGMLWQQYGSQPPSYGQARLAIYIDAYPPDKRKRDLDNLLKATLDALQYARLFDDDAQIDQITITRRESLPAGQLIVTLDRAVGKCCGTVRHNEGSLI